MKKNQRFYHVLRYALDAIAIAVAFVFIQDLYHVSKASLFFQVIFVVIFTSTWYVASIYSKLYAERRSNKFSEEIIFIFYNSVLFSVLISAINAERPESKFLSVSALSLLSVFSP